MLENSTDESESQKIYVSMALISTNVEGHRRDFEEGGLSEKEHNVEEDESIPTSIDDAYSVNDSDDGYTSTNFFVNIQDRSQIYPEFNARDAILRICYHIKWKLAELSANNMVKYLNKFFKDVVN